MSKIKRIFNNSFSILLLYISFFLLVAVKWGKIDAQVFGLAIGTLISPVVIMLLIRTYKEINRREFWAGVASVGLGIALADLLGLIMIINLISIVALLLLLIRGAYLLVHRYLK